MWRNVKANQGQRLKVPEDSGVYVIAKVGRDCGLPVGFEVLYCGKAVKLRRRFVEHIGEIEPNPRLMKAMRNEADIEFWWRLVPARDLGSQEKELIKELKPRTNVIGNRAAKINNSEENND